MSKDKEPTTIDEEINALRREQRSYDRYDESDYILQLEDEIEALEEQKRCNA